MTGNAACSPQGVQPHTYFLTLIFSRSKFRVAYQFYLPNLAEKAGSKLLKGRNVGILCFKVPSFFNIHVQGNKRTSDGSEAPKNFSVENVLYVITSFFLKPVPFMAIVLRGKRYTGNKPYPITLRSSVVLSLRMLDKDLEELTGHGRLAG